MKCYELIRNVSKKECPWLSRDFLKGEIIYPYYENTYGYCMQGSYTEKPKETPFFEFPFLSLKEHPFGLGVEFKLSMERIGAGEIPGSTDKAIKILGKSKESIRADLDKEQRRCGLKRGDWISYLYRDPGTFKGYYFRLLAEII